jgi:hypothetical protein
VMRTADGLEHEGQSPAEHLGREVRELGEHLRHVAERLERLESKVERVADWIADDVELDGVARD